MKLPFSILAVLLFLLGGPLGLVQYHSRAAFIEPPAHPLLKTMVEPQLTWSSIGELHSDPMSSTTAALNCPLGSVGDLPRISHTFVGRNKQTPTLPERRSQHCGHFREHGIIRENCVCAVPARLCDLVPAYGEKCDLGSYYEALCAKWFACLQFSEQTPGLLDASARAIAKSWTKWQPTLVALPEQLAELRDRELHQVWLGRLEVYAAARRKAAGEADLAAIQSLASALGGSVVDRLGTFCDSHLPRWLADRLKPAPIPGLLAATATAIGTSGIKWQPTLVALPERLNELRKQDVFAIWGRRFERYARARLEAAALARTLPHYEADRTETLEPAVIIASRTPLPAAATIALGTLTSDLGIVAVVPVGRAVMDMFSDLQSPPFRITKLAEPALWRPALLRAIGNFGRSGVHRR